MVPRRTFLKAGALASLSALAAPLVHAATTGSDPGPRHFVLVDDQLPASSQFGAAFAPEARIARHALLMHWTQLQQALGTHGAISGVTRRSDLPLVQQLVVGHGAQLVFESANDLRIADAAVHAGWEQVLVGHAERRACSRAGELPMSCRSGVAPQVTAPDTGFLVGWTLHYGAA
nr:hypothetical protein [Pseudomonas sp. HS-2]